MPRKAFVADLHVAIQDFQSENFASLRAGDEDGTINFEYITHDGATQATTIQAIVPGKIPVHIPQCLQTLLSLITLWL
jgi:hypothetical protein